MKEFIVAGYLLAGIAESISEGELIRCKDCKHGRLYAHNRVDCEYMELARDADWFCADGERREAE